MSSPAAFLKVMACTMMTLAGVLGGVFAAGYAFSDLDTAQAVGSTAPWLVLALALSAFAFWSHRVVLWAFVALTAFTVVRGPVEAALGLADRDDPFSAIWVLVLGVALGFLGLRHARVAGGLLAALGLGQLVAVLVSADRGGASMGELLTTSSGAVIVPVFVVAVLFLVADALAHGGHPFHASARHPTL